MHVFHGNFRFFHGIQITPFCHRSRIHWNAQCINLPLCSFKGDMNSSLYRLNVEIARKSLRLIFDNFNSFILHICYYGCKKSKKWNDPQIQYKIKLLISEIKTSHACSLKRLETRVTKIKWLSNQESEGTMSYIVGDM